MEASKAPTLADFEVLRVLQNNADAYSTILLAREHSSPERDAHLDDSGTADASAAQAVIIVRKRPFADSGVGAGASALAPGLTSSETFHNDKWRKYDVVTSDSWEVELSVSTYMLMRPLFRIGAVFSSGRQKCCRPNLEYILRIHPADDRDIMKYSPQSRHLVRETPEMYRNVTLPFIEKIHAANKLEWVYNILDGTKEAENVYGRGTEHLIVKDYKWSAAVNPSCSHYRSSKDSTKPSLPFRWLPDCKSF